MVVISLEGSLVVARGPDKTIRRHVTFFKKLVPKHEADIPELLVSNKSSPPPISQLTPSGMEPLPDSLVGQAVTEGSRNTEGERETGENNSLLQQATLDANQNLESTLAEEKETPPTQEAEQRHCGKPIRFQDPNFVYK